MLFQGFSYFSEEPWFLLVENDIYTHRHTHTHVRALLHLHLFLYLSILIENDEFTVAVPIPIQHHKDQSDFFLFPYF